MKECSKCLVTKPLSEFYTSSSAGAGGYQSRCKPCCKHGANDWAQKNKEKRNARRNERDRAKRRERGLKAFRRTAQEAAEIKRIQERDRYWKNTDILKARIKRWKQSNPHLVAQSGAKRKAAKLKATTIWANSFFIKEAYALARLRSEITRFKWHVDHIVPLQNEIVCGLHNEFNIRVIPASINCSKQNKYWPDMP